MYYSLLNYKNGLIQICQIFEEMEMSKNEGR